MMDKRKMKKIFAMMLCICMMLSSLSWGNLMTVKADNYQEELIETEESKTEEGNSEEESEKIAECTTDTTIFDLGGNRKMAVFHGADVRFENEEGDLVEYDPSLVSIEGNESVGGTSLEGYSYENREGDSKQYLPETLTEETPILLEKEGYRISFHLILEKEEEPQTEEAVEIQESETEEEASESQESEAAEEVMGEVVYEENEDTPAEIVEEETEGSAETEETVREEMEGNTEAEETETEHASANAEEIQTAQLQDVSLEEMETTDLYGKESVRPLKAVYAEEKERYQLEYESSDIGVKENIVLKECPRNNRFSFLFRVDGLRIQKDTLSEGIFLYDKVTDELVGSIDAPYMNDASGAAYSEEVRYELEETEEDAYLVTVVPDREYLDSADRVYPVTIDPTVTWTASSRIQDAYVCKRSPDAKYAGGVIGVGYDKATGIYRTYMKFVDIRKELKGKYVESAKLNLYETAKCVKGETVRAYRIKDEWKVSTLTWNTKPAHNTGSYYSEFTTTGKDGTKKTLDLTENARQMARDQFRGHGVMLRGARETASGVYTEFYGSRCATAAKRPKLTVVYYDGPTTPTAVQVGSYYKKGSPIQVTWSGISSRALDYVQYKIVKINDATVEEVGTYIDYSESTKIGTASSGTATIAGSNTWAEGCYRIWVRGVDKSGVAGTAKSWRFHIDGTAPTFGSVLLSTSGVYTSGRTPTLSWSGITENHLKEVQYQVGNGAFVTAGTAASGSVVIPAYNFPSSGAYSVKVRAVDHSGNVSAVRTISYLVDITAPAWGSMTMQPEAGVWTDKANPIISFSGITEAHSGMRASGIKYSMTPAGQAAGTYKAAVNVNFTSSVSPYAGSFGLDSADQSRADGAYTIHVRLEDAVGNAITKDISYKKDRNAPTGYVVCSDDKKMLSGKVQLSANCSDGSGSGVKQNSLVLKDMAGKLVATIYSNTSSTSVNCSFNTETVKNGAYVLSLAVEDRAGHTARIEEFVTIRNSMRTPLLTGSNRKDGYGNISWVMPTSRNDVVRMEYEIDGSGEWTAIPDSGKERGSYLFSLPSGEKEYRIKVRAVGADHNIGAAAETICVYDATLPEVRIKSYEWGEVKATVQDKYLRQWRLEIKDESVENSSYRTLASGVKAVDNEKIYALRLTDSNYLAGHTYQIRLYAVDLAGNVKTNAYTVVKHEDDYGDLKETAYTVSMNSRTVGKIDYAGDRDMFRFVPNETGTYAIETISDMDTYGTLFDASGVEIASNDDGKGVGESKSHFDFYISYRLVAGETYYIGVKAYNQANTGEYTLQVGFADKYGNTQETAFDLSEQYCTTGALDYEGDVDYFRFVPKETGEYIFTSQDSISLKTALESSHTGETLPKEEKMADGNFRYEGILQKGVSYFIKVEAATAEAMGAYKIYVETPLAVQVE